MVFLVMGRSAENAEETKKTDRRKTLKSEEKEKRRIRGKTNNNDIYVWFYLLYKKLYFARKHSLKNHQIIIKFCLQFLCAAGYLKYCNDTPKLFM